MSIIGIDGFRVPEALIAVLMSCGTFLVLPFVIYFVVRRAVADGARDAAKRGEEKP